MRTFRALLIALAAFSLIVSLAPVVAYYHDRYVPIPPPPHEYIRRCGIGIAPSSDPDPHLRELTDRMDAQRYCDDTLMTPQLSPPPQLIPLR